MITGIVASQGGGGGAFVPPDTTPPTITNSNEGSVISGATLAFALTADEAVTWSTDGGPDAAEFEISGSTLRWLSNGTRSTGSPTDSNGDNVYEVLIKATDTSANESWQYTYIFVTDGSGWFTAFDSGASFGADVSTASNQNTRSYVPSAVLHGSANAELTRITFLAAAATQLDIVNAAVGVFGSVGPNYSGSPTNITFDTGSQGATIAAGATKLSDEFTFTFASGQNLLVAIQHGGTSSMRGAAVYVAAGTYAKNTASDETFTNPVSGYGLFGAGSTPYGVRKIEVKKG